MSRTYRNRNRICDSSNLELYLKDQKSWWVHSFNDETYYVNNFNKFNRDKHFGHNSDCNDYRNYTNKMIRTDNKKKIKHLKSNIELFESMEFKDKKSAKYLTLIIW